MGFDRQRFIKKNRRPVELVKAKNQYAYQQDQELHRHFYQAIHQQTHTALCNRTGGKVPAYLRLIGTEIRKGQEEPANNAAEKIILITPVKFSLFKPGGDHIQL